MARGIRNPFYNPEPKKDFVSVFDPDDPRNTEEEIGRPLPMVRLDGDSYVLEFKGITFDDVRHTLVSMLLEINKKHSAYLKREGIRLTDPGVDAKTETGELSLKTPLGTLTVYVGDDDSEYGVFRRLGYALSSLPSNEVLAKYKVRVIPRG